jgi:hypothetical protein
VVSAWPISADVLREPGLIVRRTRHARGPGGCMFSSELDANLAVPAGIL